jgi:uncharacterized beta-barrel protein YwiB (DUF1934 family)
MMNCRITITTTADEHTTETVRNGQATLSLFSAEIVYQEENAEINISLQDGVLKILRRGDYSQELYFQEGKTLAGKIGIGGADGVIYTRTKRLSYSLTDTSLLLSLHYDLCIGDDPQAMKIRLFVKRLDA